MKTDYISTDDACEELPKLPIADPADYNVLTAESWDTQWKTEEAYLTRMTAAVTQRLGRDCVGIE